MTIEKIEIEKESFAGQKPRFQLLSDYKYLEPSSHSVSAATTRTGKVHISVHFFKQAILPTETDGKPTVERVNLGLGSATMTLALARKLQLALERAIDQAEKSDGLE